MTDRNPDRKPVRELRVARVEVGRPTSGPVRLALEVDDSAPWSHRNVRLRAPDGMRLTLFTVIE